MRHDGERREPKPLPDQRLVVALGQLPGIVHELEPRRVGPATSARRRSRHRRWRRPRAVADDGVEARLLHGAAQHEAVAAHHPDEVEVGEALAQARGVAEMGAQIELVRLEAERAELGERVVDLGAIDLAGHGGAPS